MLRNASPEAHNGWVTLLDGLNGFVPDPLAIDPRKRRPPLRVTMDGTSALTGSVKRFQLGVFHVPVHRYKAQGHDCISTYCLRLKFYGENNVYYFGYHVHRVEKQL